MLDPIKDIIRLSGLPDPILHVLLGLAIFIVSAALLRRSWGNWAPWLITLAAQIINEVADVTLDVLQGDIIRWRGSLIDTAVTMALPTLLFVSGRLMKAPKSKLRRRRPFESIRV